MGKGNSSGDNKSSLKPIRCKAAVSRKAGEPLVMEEIIVAPPQPNEVRIRIICTTLCHCDITFWKLQVPEACFPRILGHEAIGSIESKNLVIYYKKNSRIEDVVHGASSTSSLKNRRVVESVGENVKEVVEGDNVLPTFMSDCGDCVDCKSHKSNLCSKFPFKVSPWMPRYENSSRFTDLNGDTLLHFLNVSSFSEYTVLDVANIVKIDSSVPPSRACLLSCGISAGIGAAWETAKVEQGSTVVIFGLGSIGLAVAQGARLCGASRIIGVDINPAKFEVGQKFGVTEFVNSMTCENKRVSEVINEMTSGGADYCFECVGSSSMVQEAYACCRKGWGKTITLGVDKGSQICLDSFDVLQHGKILMGALFGGLKAKTHIPLLLKRYLSNELELDKFVTHEMKFEEINDAFQLLLEGKCIRCVLWMD